MRGWKIGVRAEHLCGGKNRGGGLEVKKTRLKNGRGGRGGAISLI